MSEDERQLITLAQAGDRDAFLALTARHDRQVMAVVYRFSGNLYDREDLYQEVFLHCWQSIRRFGFRSSFSTWLYRLALNRCLSLIRKRPPVAEPVDSPAEPVDFERREKLRAVRQAMLKLRGPQQLSFHLFYIEDWDVGRIAELLECREGTVKSHLNRARKKIRAEREVLVWRTNP